MPDQVRHDGKEEKAGFWLGTCQNDGKGVRLSSRNAPIRDLALALLKDRRCRIKSGTTGREEKAGFWLGTCQNDVRGLSSRNAPIRDPLLGKP